MIDVEVCPVNSGMKATMGGTPSNNAMHPTKGARSGRFAADHLEAPFAGDCECYAGTPRMGFSGM